MTPEEIKKTLELIAGAKLHSVGISLKGFSMKVEGASVTANGNGHSTAAHPAATSSQAVAQQPEQHKATAPEPELHIFKSTMVGTFFSAPSPDKPAFVKPGDEITEGDPLCTIKALQLFHEVPSDVAGTVEDVLVKDGESVGYDQPLFSIKKHV